MAIAALKRRVPLWAFLLLAILCLAMLGVACACLSDQPAQAADRAHSAMSALPGVVELWSFGLLALALVSAVFLRRTALTPSPVALQRLLL